MKVSPLRAVIEVELAIRIDPEVTAALNVTNELPELVDLTMLPAVNVIEGVVAAPENNNALDELPGMVSVDPDP